MTAAVTIQPIGFIVQYPKTQWRVSFVEDSSGKFRFLLSGRDFKFEPRDRYRYPSHDDAKRAACCFLELMKRLERSRMKLSVLAEIGILSFPTRDLPPARAMAWSLTVLATVGRQLQPAASEKRSSQWYKHPDTAITKAKAHIDRELAVAQIRGAVGWV
jgi:hypothetical protein